MKSFIKSKKFFLILILAEVVFLAIFLLFIRLNRKNNFKSVPLSLSDFTSDIATVNNDGSMQVYNEYQQKDSPVDYLTRTPDISDSVLFLSGPDNILKKGNYTLTLNYSASDFQVVTFTSGEDSSDAIHASPIILDRTLFTTQYQFYVDKDIQNFSINIYYNNNGFFRIDNISLYSNDNGVKRGFVYLLLAFFIFDIIFLLFLSKKETRLHWLAIFGITFLSSLPLFYSGLMNTVDCDFHLMRIEGIVQEIKLRHFPIRVPSVWLGGYGYPSSIFYGDILLYFPAFLRLFGIPVYQAYKTYLFAINLCTAITSEYCFRKVFNSKRIGLLTATVYCLATYRLTDVYIRSAVGEYTPFLFYPIIIFALYRIYCGPNKGLRKNLINGLILSLGCVGVFSSHMLSTEMMIFTLIVFALLMFKKTFTINTLRTILFGVMDSVLLSAYYLIPFLDYYRNVPVKISTIVSGKSEASSFQDGGGNAK